eukprot:6455063-Pyramimonas_sp.AAC.1
MGYYEAPHIDRGYAAVRSVVFPVAEKYSSRCSCLDEDTRNLRREVRELVSLRGKLRAVAAPHAHHDSHIRNLSAILKGK